MHEGESKKQLSNASKTYFRNSHLKALSMIETFGLAAYGNTLDNKFTDGYLFGLKTALADIEKRKRTHERISRELSDNIIRSQLETIVFDEATREGLNASVAVLVLKHYMPTKCDRSQSSAEIF